ncbi:MAG TPA: hypothetical protein VGE29_07015 [Prosthecobacter sp.]
MKTAFCTLCEGDYHLGAAALLNSLIACGFDGVYVIGWRGAPPPWLEGLEKNKDGGYVLQKTRIVLEELRTPWLLAHVKPRFMLDVLHRMVPEAEAVFYADPDIVVDAPWAFFESWVGRGVAICEDCCFPNLSRHHYLRLCWRDFIHNQLGMQCDPTIERDYNSGFAGVMRGDTVFLETWDRALVAMEKSGVSLAKLKPGTRFDAFFGTDQDAMNMAAMTYGDRLSTLGPEGMGFSTGMTAMWHAVDSPKPWRKRYLRSLLREGRRVDNANRQFWKHARWPVQAWSSKNLLLRDIDRKAAIFLSRFYHSA